MTSDSNMSNRKMSGFVSFPLFEFTLITKLKNFSFESHWNILIFFDNKMMSDFNMSNSVEIGLSFAVWVELWQWVEKNVS